MSLRIATLLLISLAVSARSVDAQARIENALQPGARVRYEIPRASRPFTGRVEQVDSDGLQVRPDGIDTSIHLGLDSLQSLAVFEGVRSAADGAVRGVWTGFRIGLVLGALLTTAVWLSPADERCDDCFIPPTIGVAQLSVMTSLGLGLLGGLLGAAAPGELWREVVLRRR